jgi:hypothetical protein
MGYMVGSSQLQAVGGGNTAEQDHAQSTAGATPAVTAAAQDAGRMPGAVESGASRVLT